MKFAENVPYYVKARAIRELAKKPFNLMVGSSDTHFEQWLHGGSSPLVRNPFIPYNVLCENSTIKDENRKRVKLGTARLMQHVAVLTESFEVVFGRNADLEHMFAASGQIFNAVFASVPLLDPINGKILAPPRIVKVQIADMTGTSRDTFTFDIENDSSVLSKIRVQTVFPVVTFDDHYVAGIVEDFTDMQYTIRTNGHSGHDQTELLKKHLMKLLSKPGFAFRRILVDGLSSHATLLRELGFEVRFAETTDQALSLVRAAHYDLFIGASDSTLRSSKEYQPLLKTILIGNTPTSIVGDRSAFDASLRLDNNTKTLADLLGLIDLLVCP